MSSTIPHFKPIETTHILYLSVIWKIKYMLFAGREVRFGKNCARGLEYGPRAQAEGRKQDRGHSFSQYGPT